jgi:hypothetical protein
MPLPTVAFLAPEPEPTQKPNSVLKVERAELAFITSIDQNGVGTRQLAIITKDNRGQDAVLLLDQRELGIGTERTQSGFATSWLKDGVLKLWAALTAGV